jgi:SAM-dependent methyltransferase
MTWEEVIIDVRKRPDFKQLVNDAYFGEDLVDCVTRYKNSDEFRETIRKIEHYEKGKLYILDLGAGNGISSVAFALLGHKVVALEPDKSQTVGAGAIEFLKNHFSLENLEVVSCFAEDMPYKDETFDVVFARQAMHHAYNLKSFVKQSARVLKPKGIFFTIRDHVVNDQAQKEIFLKEHPLHKYYGGENAFSVKEYTEAMSTAKLSIREIIGPYDSIINYFPNTEEAIHQKIAQKLRLPFLPPAWLLRLLMLIRKLVTRNYSHQAGRNYSFIAQKH